MTTYYEDGMLDVLMKLGMLKAADDPDVGAQAGYARAQDKAKKEKAEAAAKKKSSKPKKPPSAKDAVTKAKSKPRTRTPASKGLLAGVPMWAKVLGGAGVGAGGYAAYKKYMENKQQPPVAQYPGVGTI